jgi:hypothetical protein
MEGNGTGLGIGLGVGAFFIAGAILINGCAQRSFAAREADTALILKAISTDPVQAGKNLSFLVKSEVIASKKQRDKLADVIQNTRSGSGPALAAADDNSKCPMPVDARQKLDAGWLTIACEYWWPPHKGFDAPSTETELKVGTLLDRFGSPTGNFLSPNDTAYDKRAIPYDETKVKRYRYKVLQPLKVQIGSSAPWFDQPGRGIQYLTSKSVLQLVKDKVLEDVTPAN